MVVLVTKEEIERNGIDRYMPGIMHADFAYQVDKDNDSFITLKNRGTGLAEGVDCVRDGNLALLDTELDKAYYYVSDANMEKYSGEWYKILKK